MCVPSTSSWPGTPSMPVTPPQVLVPTTGPRPSRRMAAVTMSPSDPANSSATVTSGPRRGSGGCEAGCTPPPLSPPRPPPARPPAHPPADPPAGHLPPHQLGDVPAAVPAHVHDQAAEPHLGAQVTVEMGP